VPSWLYRLEDEDRLKAIVEEAGGIFLGVNKVSETEEPWVWFNDASGSTRILPVSEVTLENVRTRLGAGTSGKRLPPQISFKKKSWIRTADTPEDFHGCAGCHHLNLDLAGTICAKAEEVMVQHGEIKLQEWLENFMQNNACELFESSVGEKKPVMHKTSWLR